MVVSLLVIAISTVIVILSRKSYALWNINLNQESTNHMKITLPPPTIKSISSNYTGEIRANKKNITKIVFENNLHEVSGFKEVYNLAIESDGLDSIKAYLVPNENDETKYTAYIHGKGGIKANPDSSYFFYSFYSLTEIEGLEYFDTSDVLNMSYMFSGCSSLTNLKIDSFNMSNVENTSYMFWLCSGLINLNLDNFNSNQITNMSGMFSECGSLTELSINSHITQVKDISRMFYKCSNLTNIDLSGISTSNVTTMDSMFYDCRSLTSLNLSNFDTGQVTSMSNMFFYCSSLTNLDLSNFDTSQVTTMYSMFIGCSGLTSLNLSNFNTSKVTTMDSMFSRCNNLTTAILISTIKTTSYSRMFFDFATTEGTQIIVNYTSETSELVDGMIATKSASSNVVKGKAI